MQLNTTTDNAAAIKAAQTAASSKHALINLTRLVHSLAEKVSVNDPEDEEASGEDWVIVKRDAETVTYARALLEAIRDGNEQSSSAHRTLDELSKTLERVEKRYETASTRPSPRYTTSTLPEFLIPPANFPSQSTSTSIANNPLLTPPLLSPPLLRQRQSSTVSITTSNTRDYLAVRRAEDAKGEEAGLLPLKVVSRGRGVDNGVDQRGDRDKLLGGSRGEINSLGSAQLHDELGGQLADMSHRLKLNALHFASSLDEEKTLLDNSQLVLENNLVSTRSSKAQLATVSKKGRGTTCLTLGVVGLVMVLWIWMYMLIRFT